MSKPLVHFGVCYQKPNESDTEGDYGLACGKEYANPKITEYEHLVTCSACKRSLKK